MNSPSVNVQRQGLTPDIPAILSSMRRRIRALGLNLDGLTVVTEAATGAYACTAPLAAMAGARVYATARDTRSYGSFEDASSATLALAEAAGVADRISIGREIPEKAFSNCDILTNSGHLRPISAGTIRRLPKHAVLGLMFEAWELRESDFDIAACRSRGVRIAAVNERHPNVGVFDFLGPLLTRQMADAGVTLRDAHVGLICDNPFAPYLSRGLTEVGARVTVTESPAFLASKALDAVVVALDPARNEALTEKHLRPLAAGLDDAILVQFWGDIDREAAKRVWPGPVWPPKAPAPGHMAILLSDLGHEPVVRLQAGGLHAAALVARNAVLEPGGVAELV